MVTGQCTVLIAYFRWLKVDSGGFRWIQVDSGGFRWIQVDLNGFKADLNWASTNLNYSKKYDDCYKSILNTCSVISNDFDLDAKLAT
jgi:hypothetical protein